MKKCRNAINQSIHLHLSSPCFVATHVYFPAVAPPLATAGEAVPVDAKNPPTATTSVFSINARRWLVTAVAAVVSTTAAAMVDDEDEGRVKAEHVVVATTTSRQPAK
jgi:hypothetical protein